MTICKVGTFLKVLIPIAAATSVSTMVHADEASNLSTIHYSKEDLAQGANPTFIRSRDLSDVLSEKLKLIAVTLTQRQGGSNAKLVEMANTYAQPTHEQNMKKLGTMIYDPDTKTTAVDGDALRTHLSGQTRKTFEVKFKEAVPLVDQIRKGFNFKLSMDKSAPTAPASAPEIRYGLIVSDIEPSAAPGLASLGSSSDLGMEYATPAHVVYTIDRIDEQSGRKVFHDSSANTESFTNAPTATSAWRNPSTDVDVKVEAANTEESVSDKVTGGALPGAKLTFSQADGFIATQIVTNSKLGKESVIHEFKLPIAGEANLSRKVDEHMKPLQTSINNMLVNPSAPKLNLFYLHTEERFKSELLVRRSNYDMGITAEPRQGWGPKQRIGETGDKISLTFNQNF